MSIITVNYNIYDFRKRAYKFKFPTSNQSSCAGEEETKISRKCTWLPFYLSPHYMFTGILTITEI